MTFLTLQPVLPDRLASIINQLSQAESGPQLEGMHLASLVRSYGLVQGGEAGVTQARSIFRMAQKMDQESGQARPLCDSALAQAMEAVNRQHQSSTETVEEAVSA